MTIKGLMTCLVAMISWAILIVTSKGLIRTFQLDPWIFTVIQLMFGGGVLVLLGGQLSATLSALKSPFTWGYGLTRVLSAAGFTASLLYISAANAGFLAMISVPLSALVFAVVYTNMPSKWELPGHILIVLGAILLATTFEGGYTNPAVPIMIFSEMAVVLSTLLAEIHPQNQGSDPKERATLSGVMLLTSAFLFLVVFAALSILTGETDPSLAAPSTGLESVIPALNLAQVWSPLMWLCAIAVGITMRGPSTYLSLVAIKEVGSRNYVATLAILPFSCLVLELLADGIGLFPQALPAPITLLTGVMMTAGSLAVLWAASKQLCGKWP